MLKLLGAIFVTGASLMVGYAAGQGLSRHLTLLRQLRLGLELMRGEMELNMLPVAELFREVGFRIGGEVGAFFEGSGMKMMEVTGRSPQMAMRIRMEEAPLAITGEEKAMLLELGGALGRYDLMGQARALQLFQDRVDRLIGLAEATKAQKSKAWMTASVCSGLMLVLLML